VIQTIPGERELPITKDSILLLHTTRQYPI